jgi:hypothetical protein
MRIAALAVALLLVLASAGCRRIPPHPGPPPAPPEDSAVRFARATWQALCRGDAKVASQIDWPRFKAFGDDVAARWQAAALPAARRQCQTKFITDFGRRSAAGKELANLPGWAVTRGAGDIIVTAKMGPATLYFRVARRGLGYRLESVDTAL